MTLIEQITADPNQSTTVLLDNGKKLILKLLFKPNQIGWFLSLTYEDVTINTIRITTSPNFLYQFKNIIPFGLACFVTGNEEPTFLEDFESGRAQLFVLSEDEITFLEGFFSGQETA